MSETLTNQHEYEGQANPHHSPQESEESMSHVTSNHTPATSTEAALSTATKGLRTPIAPGSVWSNADFLGINIRNLLAYQLGWNYERMQGSGYLFLIAPQLKKLYGDDTQKLKEALALEARYFNTSPFFNTIMVGLDLALQEERGSDAFEDVERMKTGLMGSFASIGDALFVAVLPTIFGAIAAVMALAGNPLGLFIWIGVALALLGYRWRQLRKAYIQRESLVTGLSLKLNRLTDTGMLVALFVVGALIALVIPVKLSDFTLGAAQIISLQSVLNTIMPALLPAGIVGGIYALLGTQNMTSTKVILIVLIVSVVLGGLGWIVV